MILLVLWIASGQVKDRPDRDRLAARFGGDFSRDSSRRGEPLSAREREALRPSALFQHPLDFHCQLILLIGFANFRQCFT